MRIQRFAGIALFILIGGAALAQTPQSPQAQGYGYAMGPGMMGPGMMGQGGMMGGAPMGPWMMGAYGNAAGGNAQSGAGMCNMMSYRMGGRLAYLKTELQIGKAQEALWNAYAQAVQDNSQGMVARCNSLIGANRPGALNLPDRLARHEQFMAAQLDALRAVDKSLKPLYEALSESQKKAADQLIWGPMGMM